MKKRVGLLTFIGISLLFLVGWSKKQVELLDDGKLIDLKAAIEVCQGADSMNDETDTDNKTDTENEHAQEETTDVDHIDTEEKTIVISVRDRRITYDSMPWSNIEGLQNQIRKDYSDKVVFRLVDDFAEAHVYKKIITILAELDSEIGLVYTTE